MKYFLILLLLLPLIGIAQCWKIPEISQLVEVYGGLGNKVYNGDIEFLDIKDNSDSKETISNSVNWNNWNKLSFIGNFNIVQTINMNGNKKVYFSKGSSILHSLNMSGSDTVYIEGELDIKKLISNNSNNVVILGLNSRVSINNQWITTKTNIGNLQILPCSDPTLPIKFSNFKAKRILGTNKIQIEFKYEDAEGIEKFEIMVSLDGGRTEKPILLILPYKGNSGYFSTIITIPK